MPRNSLHSNVTTNSVSRLSIQTRDAISRHACALVEHAVDHGHALSTFLARSTVYYASLHSRNAVWTILKHVSEMRHAIPLFVKLLWYLIVLFWDSSPFTTEGQPAGL